MGPSIRYVTLFLDNFDPLPCHTLSHIPGPPKKYVTYLGPPDFSRPSTKTRTKPPCTNSLSIVRGSFCQLGFCQRLFCLEGFVRGWFLSVPNSARMHLLQQKVNITLNCMFHM